MGISVVINTYNAGQTLEKCLKTVSDFDQIVICDMHSTDNTVEIARQYNCKITYHEHTGFVEPARNYAISQADNEWVLVVDSDEGVTPELRDYLYDFILSPGEVKGMLIPIVQFFMGKFSHGLYPLHVLRFMRKDSVYWAPVIHTIPEINGEVRKISSKRKDLALRHYDIVSLSYFVTKMNTYTDNEVAKNLEKGKKITLFGILLSMLNRFIKFYIFKGGFRDGKEGFVYAYLFTVYKFLIYAKMLEHQHKNNGK